MVLFGTDSSAAVVPIGAIRWYRFVRYSGTDSPILSLTSGNLIPHYKPQGKMLYFEKSELEAWLRQNPVKTKTQIEQEAQKYVLNHPLKK